MGMSSAAKQLRRRKRQAGIRNKVEKRVVSLAEYAKGTKKRADGLESLVKKSFAVLDSMQSWLKEKHPDSVAEFQDRAEAAKKFADLDRLLLSKADALHYAAVQFFADEDWREDLEKANTAYQRVSDTIHMETEKMLAEQAVPAQGDDSQDRDPAGPGAQGSAPDSVLLTEEMTMEEAKEKFPSLRGIDEAVTNG